MKKIFTLIATLFMVLLLQAQPCTTSGFDICEPGTGTSSDFRNAILISGTGGPLSVGAKYKFTNAIPSLNLDAIISIDAIVNATISGTGIDDDGAANETGIAGTQSSLFAPHIAPDQNLSCSDRSGYVEFSVKFYTHYNGNGFPSSGTEMAVANLNLINFDMDGFTVGTNGWFKETGYVKTNLTDPANFLSPATELTNSGNINGWILTTGSTTDRPGIARCNEVIDKTVYSKALTTISFRLGYIYKAPTANCNNSIQPVRDYGVRFGCFNLPSAGPLPVSLINFTASVSAGKTLITWTSLQEHNLDSYEIQRSFDGTNFEVAGDVKANNLTSVQNYGFVDNIESFNAKNIYYRLRIADLDHSMKLTNTVVVKIAPPKANEMMVMPNPSTNNAQIKVITQSAGKGVVSVFDASGKVVLKQEVSLLTGNNTIVLNYITALSEGYYTIHLSTNNEVFTSKLLIWK